VKGDLSLDDLEDQWETLVNEVDYMISEYAGDSWRDGYPDSFVKTFSQIRVKIDELEALGYKLAELRHEMRKNDDDDS
jgi:hypothetical protein